MNSEKLIISCIIQKPELFKELVVTEEHFKSSTAKFIIALFKNQYEKIKTIDMKLLSYSPINLSDTQKNEVLNYLTECLDELVTFSNFSHYQEQLFKEHISRKIMSEIKNTKQKK